MPNLKPPNVGEEAEVSSSRPKGSAIPVESKDYQNL
jgi:hypothetical protein